MPSASSSTPKDEPKTLFSERPEWADVQALEQYEISNPLAPIFYSEEYKDATGYFRAIVKKGEMSERVMELTEFIIRHNPAHYTVWQYRYKTLLALQSPLEAEIKLMDELAVKFLKTYQVWHHRRLLLLLQRDSSNSFSAAAKELAFVAQSLKADEKNYHTWSHRQWVLSQFDHEDLCASELDFVDDMLNHDVRNNSAWHHRFFVVFQSGVREGEEDRARVVKRELTYTKQNISLAPNNPSAWNYLRGVLDYSKMPYAQLTSFVNLYAVPTDSDVIDIVDLDNPPPSKDAQLPCVAALEFLADIYEKRGKDDEEYGTTAAVEVYFPSFLHFLESNELILSKQVWKSLAHEHDTIRQKYWEYRIREALVNA
ncbi:hypothetical protein HGRIS_011371 [Hohenbuehelia grisea]|uniref:Protein farnesyltransferase/geranylgeranyltransferase type-1 subunit alpha n=1 Tax=Hohenbuehelia grisea TaxID=104357 RepID=A0ABR3JX30_9AGAR